MKYCKCILAGLVAIIIICGVIPALAGVVQILFHFLQGLRSGGAGIAFGPLRWHAPTLTELLFLLSAFALGFFWELRRVNRRHLPPAQSEFR
jgi:hypothetical protein